MNQLRIHGTPPYQIIALHGGPGAPGGMAPVAQYLSANFGVLEPFQTKKSISGQVVELHETITNFGALPVNLIGHSWGAWLAYIYTSKYPADVEKLILIGAGAFDERYNWDQMEVRLNRLSKKEAAEVLQLIAVPDKLDSYSFQRFGNLMSKADSFEAINEVQEVLEFQPEINQKVWKEAEALRRSGKLLKLAPQISCPVIAIHGDYDSHPLEGVEIPLSNKLQNFKMIKLEKCGHYPWNERYARKVFFELLSKMVEV